MKHKTVIIISDQKQNYIYNYKFDASNILKQLKKQSMSVKQCLLLM